MQIKTKLKSKNSYLALMLALNVGIFFVLWQNIKAANSITDLPSATTVPDETQQKIDELKKRAEVYREIIDIKKKQGETLNNQLSITDNNIEQINAQIDVSKQQIDDLNSQINRIEAQIEEKKQKMEAQKAMLSNLMQSYYEVNLTSPVISYLSSGNVASFIIQKDRIGQTGDRIVDIVKEVKATKEDLDVKSSELDKKKVQFISTKEELQKQGTTLESAKKQKANLLAQTKGEEARYSELLARVEEQKQELLDVDQFFAASGLSVDSYPKPDSKYFAPTSWYFSQRDPKWANETIGNTKTLMKSYGCAVTAVAMVFKQHGGTINPGQLSSEPIYSGDLINWPAVWSAPKLALTGSGKSHGNISWSIIDAQIAKNNPVIVYIGKTKGSGGHYVVIHHKEANTGKYVVHDPYFGANLYLDTSRALVGAMGTSSSTIINQMIIYN
ncbi:MAG: C39 family peptidase [bacterium]